MSDYTGYVAAVYGVAVVVYGGLTLMWQRALRRALVRLGHEQRQEVPNS